MLATDWLMGDDSRKACFTEGQKVLLSVAFQQLGQGFGEVVAQHLQRLERNLNSRFSGIEMQLGSTVSRVTSDGEATVALAATSQDLLRRNRNGARKQRRKKVSRIGTFPCAVWRGQTRNCSKSVSTMHYFLLLLKVVRVKIVGWKIARWFCPTSHRLRNITILVTIRMIMRTPTAK